MIEPTQLTQELTRQLDALPADGGVLHFDVHSIHLELQVSAAGPLACQVEQLCARHASARSLTWDQLLADAASLASQLAFLEEPLVILEQDVAAAEVQLRSSAPRQEPQHRSYYEVMASARQLTLQRYAQPPGQRRQVTSMTWTRDTVHRVCECCVAFHLRTV